MMKIDAVITWVDGNDPRHQEKRRKYAPSSLLQINTIAGNIRYADAGEIFWCVASLNRFAPWINRIYIVTDNQDPGLDAFLEKNFPEGHIPYEIVDHKVIFKGYEQYLPTFNSISLEAMTWRIPGLSDCFIEFNDDISLVAPVGPEDFFTADGRPVTYCSRFSLFWVRLKDVFRPRQHGQKVVTFKGIMVNGAMLAGNRFSFIKLDHTPHSLRRDWYESFFTSHPELLDRNIRHRFRNPEQFSSEVLQYTILEKSGQLQERPVKGYMFYMDCKDKPDYVSRKMARLAEGNFKFCCFNSVGDGSEEDQKKIRTWICDRLGIVMD